MTTVAFLIGIALVILWLLARDAPARRRRAQRHRAVAAARADQHTDTAEQWQLEYRAQLRALRQGPYRLH